MPHSDSPVALVTGSAKRLGKHIVCQLHQAGYRVIIHYNQSASDASNLAASLNRQRPNSASTLHADLLDNDQLTQLASDALHCFNRLDVLVNNASSFYPTPLSGATLDHWDDLFGSNVKAPYFLAQALAPSLSANKGCIINMVDIHASQPLQDHSIYCMAKAALLMMTKSLARELAPTIRVNGIAPGAILWPSQALDEADKAAILQQIPLQRIGSPDDIASTVLFLVQSPYISGQIIAVDGGRSLGTAQKA
ncbi:MAG: pteridine reductase [Rheinheimera sp.]|uniref:pteridine reductase n=1 Tax=Arsukibacterium sp. UBA3155 TaxID=1946058 RepID=UPI000C963612|nr:pteridine reductase [Arsukibacterium sp. UBA3155]MAD74635.1 pteridine reductase [Rheinheimera sp.]|tara:strand:+ start:69987 stop:70739 length:753 start_codon:yes stop_codon:yes gene_type:complete